MTYNEQWAQQRLGVTEGFTQADDKARVAAAFLAEHKRLDDLWKRVEAQRRGAEARGI